MYGCELRHKIVGPRIALVRKAVEAHVVLYPHRFTANLSYCDGNAQSRMTEVVQAKIVREMKTCAGCEISGATTQQ